MEGGTRGIQVLLSGEIQAMHVGLAPMAPANASGADLKLVASTSNVLPFVIFSKTKSDPPIPKGAKYGISTFGSETDIALSILLPKFGLKREDVEITQVGGSGTVTGAGGLNTSATSLTYSANADGTGTAFNAPAATSRMIRIVRCVMPR